MIARVMLNIAAPEYRVSNPHVFILLHGLYGVLRGMPRMLEEMETGGGQKLFISDNRKPGFWIILSRGGASDYSSNPLISDPWKNQCNHNENLTLDKDTAFHYD